MPEFEPYRRTPVFVAGSHDEGADYRVVRPKGAGDYLMFVNVEGRGLLRFGSQRVEVLPGSAVLLRPEFPQDYGTAPARPPLPARWAFFWVHFMPRAHWLDWLKWPEVGPGVGVLEAGVDAVHAAVVAMERVVQQTNLTGRYARDLGMNALEQAILELNVGRQNAEAGRTDGRVRRVLRLIATDLAAPHTVDTLAHAVDLSPSRFSTIFRREVGISPQRYLEELRLERARQLLEVTDLPIQRVSEEVGFASPFYFSTRFRRRYGTSPRGFRSPP